LRRRTHPVLAFIGFVLGAMVALVSQEELLDIPQVTRFSWRSPSIAQPAEVEAEPPRIGFVSDSVAIEEWQSQHQDYHLNQVLQLRSRGLEVQLLQQRLRELGFFPGEVSGLFDESTQNAVKAFQKERGLVTDGKVGPETYSALGF
jgi:hypothetical protein